MQQAYIVISDLHLAGQSKQNRYNYDKELSIVFHKIVDLVMEHKEKEHKTYLIFLGDIFDRSYKSPQKYGEDASFFVKLKNMTDGLFSVCGNHELNFYLNNPWWTLVSEIKSPRLSSLDKVNTQPLGYENIFYVVDKFTFGDVVFHLNHYACQDSIPVLDKFNIAFWHKPLYNEIILKDAEQRGIQLDYARTVNHQQIDNACAAYQLNFCGHMHWFYGTWRTEQTAIYGLASLGRPNKAEISNDFLERNIPVIIVNDGKFKRVEDNKFNLPSKEESLIKEIDETEHIKYEILKKRKEAKTYISMADDPILNIKNFLLEQPRVADIFRALVEKSFSDKTLIEKILDLEKRC